eukprot:scaffold5772_cov105-Isochrysis_galbana.AAC.1
MQTKRVAELWAVRCRQAAARGEPSPERPTIFFVPGGAFICDFEAADYFFLHRWVRQTDAIVVYVSYDYAPQVRPAGRGAARPDGPGLCGCPSRAVCSAGGWGSGGGRGPELRRA